MQTAVVQESGLQVLAGKIVAPQEGFFHLELLDGIRHGRMGIKGEETVALIFPVEPGLHALVEQQRDLTMCRGGGTGSP